MNFFARWPRLSLALTYLALPTLFSVAGAIGTLLTGTPWDVAFWREGVYWAAWLILIPPIFRLCRWLHDGSPRLLRHVLGMTIGAGLTVILLPLFYEIVRLGLWAIAWECAWIKDPPPPYWADYRAVFFYLTSSSVIVFTCTVIAWYAVTNYREAKERQLESAELGAMLQQAQLQALRSQLNPHFLFNTLHSIAELIHENPRHAEQMVLQLGELLRKALKSQALEVPLSDEIDFIRSYLAIEQMRLGDRLELAWAIDPAVLMAYVPSLILQPIVENAILHGIAVSPQGGRLEISAARTDGQLCLVVRDDGPGLAAVGRSPGNGIGLSNTRTRLERLYGDRASFRLTGEPGLVVAMALPWRE